MLVDSVQKVLCSQKHVKLFSIHPPLEFCKYCAYLYSGSAGYQICI